ncbi:TusE/DsrC/DsvC family sulfur relay protein [Rhizobium laguerreae]|uniref:TusE/DsrC/DsvC family sulfur relay protein n=1 Tax=Rhizobium laguerreae TaxID=1076926 RepID=UPI001C8FA738|nr:TusE/DsrC/DsvC family sulfur relay protein [Rhizobium laguerreae]MBY3203467.1 TusE/DsrC/DsvC family sulfur relay protein [Rhizobium laguerreae]
MVPIDRNVTSLDEAGLSVALDADGYLANADDWTPAIAVRLARNDGLELSERHWAVINQLRVFWYNELVSPPLRILVRVAGQVPGGEHGTARALHGLFPGEPAKKACRYAGLPRPEGCL